MHYTIIDMEKDPRCGQFAYFRAMQYPFASVTVEVDITDMMTARGSRPFFLSLLYAVVRAANAVPQLRRRLLLSVIICVIAFLVLRRRGRLVPEEA